MRYYTFISFFIIILLLLLVACSRRPRYVLDEDKMADVLYDIQVVEAIYNNNPSGQFTSYEQRDALLNGVLKKHAITQAALDTSMMWYSDNVETYTRIKDSVRVRLRRTNEHVMAMVQHENQQRQLRDSYVVPPVFSISQSNPMLSFYLDSIRIRSLDLSSFRWSFDVKGANRHNTLKASIRFAYKDTTVRQTVDINTDKHYLLTKPILPDSLLVEISGYVHMAKQKLPFTPATLFYNVKYRDSVSVRGLDVLRMNTSGDSFDVPPH